MLRVVKNPLRGASVKMRWAPRGSVVATTVRLGGAAMSDDYTCRPSIYVRDFGVPKVRVCVLRSRG